MRATPLLITFSLGACAPAGGPFPSLQPRAAEKIDPRVPVVRPMNDRPVSPALAARLSELVNQAQGGDVTFRPLVEQAERLAASAGDPRSDSWVVAQEALSAAIAARDPTINALGDIDGIGATMLQSQGGLAPADLAAVQGAGAEVFAIDQRQADAIKAIQRRLGI
ncbi:MAG TPA: hypothetical protein VFY95_07930 [Sphingomicrobium sp.]